jgi:uncharacterized damage-inducible protein DinB
MTDAALRELVYGKGAHVDPVACIEDVSAELATQRLAGYPHSIWQIVLHMNFWMDHDLATIVGEKPRYPDHAIESWPQHPEPATESQWRAVQQRFVELLAQLDALADSDSSTLGRVLEDFGIANTPRQATVCTRLWQIVAHNSYHFGQIALLRRQAGAWPPLRGGDTW